MNIIINVKDVTSFDYNNEFGIGTTYYALVDDGSRKGVSVKCTKDFYDAIKSNKKGVYTLSAYKGAGKFEYYSE